MPVGFNWTYAVSVGGLIAMVCAGHVSKDVLIDTTKFRFYP